MSGTGREKRGLGALFEQAPAAPTIPKSVQECAQESTQESIQNSTQKSIQENTQNSVQKSIQENTQICTLLGSYLRDRIDEDMQRKIRYMAMSMRVEDDVGQAVKKLAENKELPHGIQQAVVNNALRIGLEALGYLEPKGGDKS